MKLNHLTNSKIDFERWDAALAKSHQPYIYASSWYLNMVSPNWEALVNEDYSTLIPLPIKKILGIKIIVQPPFCQQLGLFNSNSQHIEGTSYANYKLPFAPLMYQTKNLFLIRKNLIVQKRINLILPLQKEYNLLQKEFNQNTKRNCKKAKKFQQKIEKTFCADTFINFSQEHAPYSLSIKNWETLRLIVESSLKNERGTLWTVTDSDNSPLCMAFFLDNYDRITFLSGHSSPLGFTQKSMFLIMDHVINRYAESDKTLDFEGGSLEGVARFYKGFGAVEETYYVWQSPLLKQLSSLFNRLKKVRNLNQTIKNKENGGSKS